MRGMMKRTRLCKYYSRGFCREADTCSFAHGGADLQPRPDLYKTEWCHAMVRHGSCPRPDVCRYAHSAEELRREPVAPWAVPARDSMPTLMAAPIPTSPFALALVQAPSSELPSAGALVMTPIPPATGPTGPGGAAAAAAAVAAAAGAAGTAAAAPAHVAAGAPRPPSPAAATPLGKEGPLCTMTPPPDGTWLLQHLDTLRKAALASTDMLKASGSWREAAALMEAIDMVNVAVGTLICVDTIATESASSLAGYECQTLKAISDMDKREAAEDMDPIEVCQVVSRTFIALESAAQPAARRRVASAPPKGEVSP